MADPWSPSLARFPDLAGKVAIVTGTGRGIGCGIAEVLGSNGMRLALADRSAEAGRAFAERLSAGGADCLFIPADLATADGAAAVFDACLRRYGRLDLLVNNAADVHSKAFLELDEAAYRSSFEANMRIVYGLSLRVAQQMAATGGGVIIHISSVGGLRAHKRLAGYDAFKGAVDALTRAMAVDLAPKGIRVNAVAPGATLRSPADESNLPRVRQVAACIPLQRFATPQEIGHAVAFLASDAAAYITGQVLYVDGGLTCQLSPPGTLV